MNPTQAQFDNFEDEVRVNPGGVAAPLPRTDARAFIAGALLIVAHGMPSILAVLFVLADIALFVWQIVTAHWVFLVVTVVLSPLIVTVAAWVATLLAMPFYGLARLIDRETTEIIVRGWDD
jgi:hypothetical protein